MGRNKKGWKRRRKGGMGDANSVVKKISDKGLVGMEPANVRKS